MNPDRRRWLRPLLGLLLWLLPASSFADVAIFCYHRFDEPKYASTNIATETFEEQLQYLQENGYEVLSLGALVRLLETGEPLPEKGAVLTVDDAYRSFATGAVPLLEKYGMPATLFVSTGTVGQGSYLSWEELRDLQQKGVEIGNHSRDHRHMAAPAAEESPQQWQKRIAEDLSDSQAAFEEHLGEVPDLFAYPYGEFSPELIALVKGAGLRAAVAQQSGPVGAGQSDLYSIPRFPMGGPYATLKGFRNKVGMMALPVAPIVPLSPVLSEENPPTLRLKITGEAADLNRLQCFVQGKNSCEVKRSDDGAELVVTAEKPLTGRRNKYTLTAPAAKGRGWYWFSQPWLRPQVPE